MLRLLLTWRWAVLTVVAVAAVAVMLVLGQWQWERSRPSGAVAAADPTALPDPASLPQAPSLVGADGRVPEELVGSPVRVTGTWAPELDLLVSDRADADGTPGRWVVTGLRTDTPEGERVVPVVRGWIPAEPLSPSQSVVAPEGGEITVLGWLQASEPLDLPVEIAQPTGVAPLLSTPDLVNRWPVDLVGGFVVQAGESAAAAGSALVPRPLTEPPEDPATEPRDWRNLAYAGQWWVFAGFAIVLWWRMLRDDLARDRVAHQRSEESTTEQSTTEQSTTEERTSA